MLGTPSSSSDKATRLNPKDIIGSNKVPLHLVSPFLSMFTAVGKLNGALKYGRANFRKEGVQASIYVDATKRHLDDWFSGNDTDEDEPVHNLCAAAACIDILIDAYCTGELIDDRDFHGEAYRARRKEVNEMVKALREKHSDKLPKHYTIQDNRTDAVAPQTVSASSQVVTCPMLLCVLPLGHVGLHEDKNGHPWR